MGQNLDPEVLRSFLDEVRTYLPALDREWARLQAEPGDKRPAEELYRLAHSLRSASEMIGLDGLAEAARGVESLLAAPDGLALPLAAEQTGRMGEAIAAVKASLEAPGGGEAPPMDDLAAALNPAAASVFRDEEEIDEDLYPTFLAEAEEIMQQLPLHFATLESGGETRGALAEIRRSIHTLKGAAGMVGLDTAAHLAHRLEDLLDALVAGTIPAGPDTRAALESSTDLLAELAAARGRNAHLRAAVTARLQEFEAVLSLAGGIESLPREAEPSEDDEIAAQEETDADLLETFLAEAEELVARAGDALRTLESDPERPEPVLSELRRAIHTLKGAAGMVGLNGASAVARRFQFLLDRVLEGQMAYTPALRSLFFECGDAIVDLIEARGENSELRVGTGALLRRCDELLAGRRVETEAPAEVEAEPAAPAAAAEAGPAGGGSGLYVRVPLEKLEALQRLVSDLFINAGAFEQQLTSMTGDVSELSLNLARMRRISTALEDTRLLGTGSGPALPQNETGSAAEFDTLEFDRYTQLHLLAKDLTEATGDLGTLSSQLGLMRARFDGWLGRQRGLSAEVQDKLMRLRMVPLASLGQRLHRTVRVAAAKTGKRVALLLEGTATEFDKSMLEQLTGPLEHLLRNAVDHGIETPQARRAAGKPEAGRLRLEATTQGAQIVLRLTDDGAGLKYEAIRRRVVELGWLSEEEAARASEADLGRFLFAPGFSTAEAVSEMSGRGVGLDVVRSAVETMRGTVTVDSQPGVGTVFTLRLPMTMAVARVLLAETGGEVYGLPLAAVLQTARIDASQIEARDGAHYVHLGPDALRLVSLPERLGLRAAGAPPSGRFPVAVVETGAGEVALALDRMVEAREVVVKPLSGWLRRLPQFGGATILGDGRVVLLLNPAALAPGFVAPAAEMAPRRMPARHAREVLIVDDSVSIRRTVSALVRSAGWNARLAKDGQEALEYLEQCAHKPDVILMDIEMPRMDGYELAAAVRSRPALSRTPVVMLTSRAGDKHRRKALSLGVNEYLIKPYQDEVLLDVLRRAAMGAPQESTLAS